MRIQTRLFLGTALIVLGLMAVQWWLHVRQLQAVERQLAEVATTVGEGLLTRQWHFLASADEGSPTDEDGLIWIGAAQAQAEMAHASASEAACESETGWAQLEVMVITEEVADGSAPRVQRVVRRSNPGLPGAMIACPPGDDVAVEALQVDTSGRAAVRSRVAQLDGGVQRIELRVVPGQADDEHFLLVSGRAGVEERIPIPVSPTVEILDSVLRQGLAASAGLLVLGFVASGLLAGRLARPLQSLAEGADALGRGERGVQVPVTASGEVGELQQAFNEMSLRLEQLEREREHWRQREHLAQLGDLARGLAHTLRNPLNTLGLVVEELGNSGGREARLVATARAQIRRIDRWLRSFLAVGAGEAAEVERADLGALTQEVVLEALQQGAPVDLELGPSELPVDVVPGAIRAALANLVENAVEAAPEGSRVMVSAGRDGDHAGVTIIDRGPGLPDQVRERLFEPHVTTKVEGSGMGLFLTRQLVVQMHHGELEIGDADAGGTCVAVRLPLSPPPEEV